MSKPRFAVLAFMILAAAATRLIPHPPNATSITAMALFGGAYLSDKRLAFLAPMTALFLSDLVLGFYSRMWVVYGSFAVIVCIGRLLRARRRLLAIAGATLASSIIFFVITNLGVWIFGSLYPKTIEGLLACYVAAIPFFQNTLLGDASYTTALFGAFALVERRWSALRGSHVGLETICLE